MDLLTQKSLELFDFDNSYSIEDIVNVWKSRGLWFYQIIKNEREAFSLRNHLGQLILDQHGDMKYFISKEEALKYEKDEGLQNSEVVNSIQTFYTAKSEFERFIMTPFGKNIEFSSERKALKVARYYNDDIIKMRLSASEYRVK